MHSGSGANDSAGEAEKLPTSPADFVCDSFVEAPRETRLGSGRRDGGQDIFHFHVHLIPVPEGAPFPLQLPDPGAEVPSRSQLDVMATHVMRCIHDEDGEPQPEPAQEEAAGAAA